MRNRKALSLALLALLALAGCASGGSPEVDPAAAVKARENVKRASEGAPPGLPGAQGK